MKKIYTLFKSKLSLSLLSLTLIGSTAFGQICGPVVEDFNSTGGSTAGFTGDFSYNPAGMNLQKQNALSNIIYSITSPTYILPAATTYIGYGFQLNGAIKVAKVQVKISYRNSITGEIVTADVGSFVPNYGTDPFATPCRAVDLSDLPGFPATNRQYRFRFEFTSATGGGSMADDITFDDFRTNGTFSQSSLPVTFSGFEAKKVSSAVQLTWKVAGEENVARYEVERSEDGRQFTVIGSVAASGKDTYTFTDAQKGGDAFYRVRNVDNDGKYKYSSIAHIANGRSEIVLRAFPQPVLSQLTLQHPAITGKALISVSTADGRIVRTLTPAQGSMQTSVDMSSFQSGLYLLRFDAGDGNTQTLKVVKQ